MLLLATKSALSFEKGILFPCFAVSAMILCNIWACKLYHEKFNYLTNVLSHIPRVKLRLHIFFQTVGQESVKYVA